MVLVGWPNEREQPPWTTGVSVPGLLSFLVSGDPAKPVPGLDQTRLKTAPRW